MLELLNKNLLLLYNRFRRNSVRHSKPRIAVKKFGKPISKSHQFDPEIKHDRHHQQKYAAVYPNTFHLRTQKSIRIATFNAALFSMAPAVAPNSNNHKELPKVRTLDDQNFKSNSFNGRPKGILKQSPLHPRIMNNEYLRKQEKLRVSINLPDNEISVGRNSRRVGFVDGGEGLLKSNRAVVDVLREIDADIIGLQNVKANEEREMKPLSDLAAALGMNYVFAESWAPEYGNAVLSKWPIKNFKVQKNFDHTDFRNVLKTTIDVAQVGEVNFYCTHLDHLDENWRIKQINAIIESNNEPHILAGGLNSLDESDYSQDRWSHIVKYYEDIGKPTPKAEVMRYLKNKQYTDAKDFAGECESVVMIAKGQSTWKYGTRVDYILGSPGLEYKFVPASYAVLSSKGTSDHHIVKVDLIKMEPNFQEMGTTKKQQPVKRVNNSWSKGTWSTNMR